MRLPAGHHAKRAPHRRKPSPRTRTRQRSPPLFSGEHHPAYASPCPRRRGQGKAHAAHAGTHFQSATHSHRGLPPPLRSALWQKRNFDCEHIGRFALIARPVAVGGHNGMFFCHTRFALSGRTARAGTAGAGGRAVGGFAAAAAQAEAQRMGAAQSDSPDRVDTVPDAAQPAADIGCGDGWQLPDRLAGRVVSRGDQPLGALGRGGLHQSGAQRLCVCAGHAELSAALSISGAVFRVFVLRALCIRGLSGVESGFAGGGLGAVPAGGRGAWRAGGAARGDPDDVFAAVAVLLGAVRGIAVSDADAAGGAVRAQSGVSAGRAVRYAERGDAAGGRAGDRADSAGNAEVSALSESLSHASRTVFPAAGGVCAALSAHSAGHMRVHADQRAGGRFARGVHRHAA